MNNHLESGMTRQHFPIKREWLQVIVVFLVMRLLITLLGAFSLSNSQPKPPWWMTPGFPRIERFAEIADTPSGWENVFINGWYRWDTGYFVKIGVDGYEVEDGSMSYMPLYPLLIRITNVITRQNGLVSALLVSNLLCISAFILFYEVALLEIGRPEQAWQAFIYLITFPAAFFFYAAYSESLYLTLALAMWLFVRRGNWPMAALTSSLVILTRLQGVALIIPLGWQALVCIQAAAPMQPKQEMISVLRFYLSREGWRRLFSSKAAFAWIATGFPILTLLLYTIGAKAAGLNTVVGAYSDRHSSIAFPWQGFVEFLGRIFTIRYLLSDWIDLVLVILLGIVIVASFNKIPAALWLYTVAVLVLIFSRSYGANLLSGFMRFLLTTFPFFIGLAKLDLPQWSRNTLQIFFLLAQLFLAWAFFMWIWVA